MHRRDPGFAAPVQRWRPSTAATGTPSMSAAAVSSTLASTSASLVGHARGPAHRLPAAHAGQWPEGHLGRKPRQPDCERAGLVSRRRQRRSARPLRVRASLRAHDVQGHDLSEGRAVRSHDGGRRRQQQRLDRQRRDDLRRGDSVEPSRDTALGRSRADAAPESGRGEFQIGTRRRRRGIPRARAGLALRPLLHRARIGPLPAAPVPAPDHRQHRRPRRRHAGRRRRVPRRVLPARQRDTDRRRRLRRGAARRLGRQVLRSGFARPADAAARARGERTAVAGRSHDHDHRASRALAGGRRRLARATGDERRRARAAGGGGGAVGGRFVAPEPGARLSPADRDAGELHRRPARRPWPPDRQRDRRGRQADRRRARGAAGRSAAAGRPSGDGGRARQGEEPARHRGRSRRGRHRSASARRSPMRPCSKATRTASTPTSSRCSA